MRNWIVRLALVAFFLSAPALLKAQDAASLTGVVVDSSGAVVPGVTVVLANKLTGVKFTQTTGKDGSYIFSNVPAADGYTAIFSHDGFASLTVDKIFLVVGKTRTLDEKLGVASSTETVAVSAANEEVTLNTTDASIGNNIDVDLLHDLPVYDRTNGASTLFDLQAGVDFSSGAVTGARIDQTEVTVDGMDVNDIAAGTTFAIVATAPVDSLEQFGGTVAGLVPAVGTGSGAQFQLVTKSGSNRWYGNINEYNRNTDFTSNGYFNNLFGVPRTPLIQNQFGGNVGGAIKKDKLFFFFEINESRIVQSATGEDVVLLPNLTSSTPTLNYINNGTGCDYTSRINTNPNCISSLSATQVAALDPASYTPGATATPGFNSNVLSFLAGRFPAANDLTQGDGVNTGGYRFTVPTPDNDTTYVTKVDYNLTPKQHIFGRLTINRQNATEALPVLPTDPPTHPFIDRSYSYVASHIWTIGRNKVNQFYYGDTISKYDFPNAYNPTGANQYSLTGVSSPYSGNDGQKRRVPIPTVRDDFNWQLGEHNVTFGGTFKFIKTDSNLINDFNFVGIGATGNELGNGLDPSVRPSDIYNNSTYTTATTDYDSLFATSLGVIGDIFTNYNYTASGAAVSAGTGGPRNYRYFETELYVGDTWKIKPKFSVTYGLRYQLYTVPYETHGEESIEYTNSTTHEKSTLESYVSDRLAQSAAGNSSYTGLPIYSVALGGKANNGPNLYQPSYKDLAPRIGFAYNPVPHTVVNGSIGIVYDRTVINAINFLQDQISYLFSNQQVAQFGSGGPVNSLATNPRVGANLSYSASLNPPPAPLSVPYTPYVDDANGDNTGIPGQPFGLAAGETNFVISPNLKDPYSIAFNAGIQQELPEHMLLKLSYAGRLGRRLLADADAGQVIDVPDYTGGSTQTMAQAFAGLTTQSRAGVALTPQPWFENVLAPYGAQIGFGDNTNLVAAMVGNLAARGDMSDMLYTMAYYSVFQGFTNFLPTNIGIPSQFGSNAYLTNMGNSSYNGLLLTLVKNESHGLRFDFNYTFSHSIDNTSLSANANSLFSNSGFICDVTRPRACRGNSDFDVTQVITADFIYKLPIGTGKMLFGKAPFWVNEAIGGWSISSIPKYRSGQAVTPYAQAYLASFDNLDPAIYIGHNKSDLKAHPNIDRSSNFVYDFAGGSAGALKALADFRGPIGIEYGSRNILRGPIYTNLDAGLAKVFPIVPAEHVNLTFRADAFNILNHTSYGNPGVNIVGNAGAFGQIGGTYLQSGNANRVMQLSLRLEF